MQAREETEMSLAKRIGKMIENWWATDADHGFEEMLANVTDIISASESKAAKRPTGAEAARYMSDFINEMGFEPTEFVRTMLGDHRTLQQTFAGLALAYLYGLAESSYDGRNEEAVKRAKKVKEALGPYGASLPLI
jgi:hypothetical protein